MGRNRSETLAFLRKEKELKKGFYEELARVAGGISDPKIKADIQELIDYSKGNPRKRTSEEIDAIQDSLYKSMPSLRRLEAKYTGLEAYIGVDLEVKKPGRETHGLVASLLGPFLGKKK